MVDEDAVTGLTSNPSIFQKAIAGGGDYDEQIRELPRGDRRPARDLLRARDRRRARRLRRAAPGLGRGPSGADGYVSLEVDPGLAFDTKATFEQAVDLHDAGRAAEPLHQDPGDASRACPRSRTASPRGISINVTLIFSLERYRRRRRRVPARRSRGSQLDGGDLSKVTSVASFFVSRLDTEARRAARGAREHRAAGQARDREREARLQALRGGVRRARAGSGSPTPGATVQRPLWASTSTKNPAYRDVMYVEELIGPDTVNTMPLETLEAFARPRRGARRHGARGRRRRPSSCSPTSPQAGVDYDDVVAHARDRGRAEVRRRLRRADRGHRGQAGRAGGARDDRAARARRADLVARPDGLDGHGRGPLARLARRAVRGCATTSSRCSGWPRTSSATPTRSCCSAWAARRSRPRCCARSFGVERFHVLDTTHPQAIRELEREARPRAHALRLGVEVGLDARDALAHRLLLEARAARRAVGRDHRPRLDARRSSRASASSPRSSPASRRSAAATRRSRRSGSCRRR